MLKLFTKTSEIIDNNDRKFVQDTFAKMLKPNQDNSIETDLSVYKLCISSDNDHLKNLSDSFKESINTKVANCNDLRKLPKGADFCEFADILDSYAKANIRECCNQIVNIKAPYLIEQKLLTNDNAGILSERLEFDCGNNTFENIKSAREEYAKDSTPANKARIEKEFLEKVKENINQKFLKPLEQTSRTTSAIIAKSKGIGY